MASDFVDAVPELYAHVPIFYKRDNVEHPLSIQALQLASIEKFR